MPPAPRRLLLVEDDRTLSDLLKGRFERGGFQVRQCYDGKQAIDAMEKEAFDCILLDLLMPVKDGYAVLEAKKDTLCAAAPVYVLTNLRGDDAIKRALDLGAKRVFVKSETPAAEVIAAIRKG